MIIPPAALVASNSLYCSGLNTSLQGGRDWRDSRGAGSVRFGFRRKYRVNIQLSSLSQGGKYICGPLCIVRPPIWSAARGGAGGASHVSDWAPVTVFTAGLRLKWRTILEIKREKPSEAALRLLDDQSEPISQKQFVLNFKSYNCSVLHSFSLVVFAGPVSGCGRIATQPTSTK